MNAENQDNDESVYMFTGAEFLSADVRINPRTSVYLLPEPLTFSEPATATFFVAHYPRTLMEAVYNEACVLLHAQDEKGPALFNSWIVVDDDEMMIGGRENLGCPKKMAEITLVEDGDKVTGSVIRKGIEVLRLETTLGESIEGLRFFASHRMVNAIGIPLTGMKLYDIPPVGERLHHARHASGTLTVNPSERDPLSVMEPGPAINAQYFTMDFGIPRLEVGTLTTDIGGEWIARNYMERQR